MSGNSITRLSERWIRSCLDNYPPGDLGFSNELASTVEKIINAASNSIGENERAFLAHFKEDLKTKLPSEVSAKYFNGDRGLDPSFIVARDIIATVRGAILQSGILDSFKSATEKLIRDRLISQITPTPADKNELLRLFLHIKKEARETKEATLNAEVIDQGDLPLFLKKVEEFGYPIRFQLMVRSDIHYTTLDININHQGEASCLVLDAASDRRRLEVVELLKEAGIKRIYLPGIIDEEEDRLQDDDRSCPIFARAHLSAASAHPNLFKILEGLSNPHDNQVINFSWGALPSRFSKYSQYVDPNKLLRKNEAELRKLQGYILSANEADLARICAWSPTLRSFRQL